MRRPSRSVVFKPSVLALACTIAALSGCSSVDNLMHAQDADYQSAHPTGQGLDVPPDLTQLTQKPALTMPATAGGVSAVALQQQGQAQQQQVASNVLPQTAGIQVEQSGAMRWLVVDQTPDQLWDKISAFWQANGLGLTKTDRKAGMMQTDWAENRAQLPQDFIRRYLGKVLDSVYDTGQRDSYRTLLQRSPDGHGTEVFISHRTMVEVYSDNDKTTTVWQPGTPDPGMDLLFLQRLMVHLGMNEQQAKAAVAAAATQAQAAPRAQLTDGGQTLQIDAGFDEAWRRVSLAVNTAGFTVTDRDRSAGRFDVRFVDPAATLKQEQQGDGFFSHWFGKKNDGPTPQPLHILLQGNAAQTRLTVQSDPGNPNAAASTKAILDVLLQQLQ